MRLPLERRELGTAFCWPALVCDVGVPVLVPSWFSLAFARSSSNFSFSMMVSFWASYSLYFSWAAFFDSLRFLTEAVSVAICRLQKSSWSLSRRFSLVSLSHLRRGSSGLLVIDSGCLSQIIANGVTDFSEGPDDLFQSGNFRLEGNDFLVFLR